MRKVLRATELIGGTPVVRLNKIASEGSSTIWAKLEFFNPGGSVKDRMALAMIEEAEAKAALKSGDTVIEPTSGNAGIGLAFVAAQKGYRIILVIPEIMSVDKMSILRALGAELLLVPAGDGMSIAVETAKNLAAKHGYFMPNQFTNQANSAIHERTTGAEIAEAFADTGLDYFVAGVGTGGTITGVGRALRRRFPAIKIYAVEPKRSAVLSGGKPGKHGIEGNGAGFVPGILDTGIYDDIITVYEEDALEMCRRLAKSEGLFVGISAGAAVWASTQVADGKGRGTHLLTVIPDRGDRYTSTILGDDRG